MKKMFNLQMYAEDPATEEVTAPGTAEKNDQAAAETGKPTEPEKKYTDEDVDRIVKGRLAREQEKAKKEKEEAEKLAEMNAQQKAEYKLSQVQKELDELKRKDALSEMTKVARKMLTDEGINAPDDLLSMMVTTDAQETKKAIDSFTKLYKEAVESGVKARLKGEPPRVGSAPTPPVSEIQKRINKYS
jgi:hypothetical protein